MENVASRIQTTTDSTDSPALQTKPKPERNLHKSIRTVWSWENSSAVNLRKFTMSWAFRSLCGWSDRNWCTSTDPNICIVEYISKTRKNVAQIVHILCVHAFRVSTGIHSTRSCLNASHAVTPWEVPCVRFLIIISLSSVSAPTCVRNEHPLLFDY